MSRLCLFTFLVLIPWEVLIGQQTEDRLWQLETRIGEEENLEGIESLTELYQQYEFQPLNLNIATEQELHELNILNDFQIAMLLKYRGRSPILSVYELLYVPGFREEEIEKLVPLVECRKKPEVLPEPKKLLNRMRHQLLIRYQRILETGKGYQIRDSSSAAQENLTGYTGSPDKIYARYIMQSGKKLRASLVVEKDAGENLWSSTGFDFQSACLAYTHEAKLIRKLYVGDYNLEVGQGLLMWTSFSMGKAAGISGLSRAAAHFKENRSASENRHLRGLALTLGHENVSLSLFCSHRKLDASPADTSFYENAFTSLLSSGLHRTNSEISSKGLVKESLMGSMLRYDDNRLHLGINLLYQHYDKSMVNGEDLYKCFFFTGQENLGLSLDYRYLAGRLQLFGETSRANQAFASLNGMLIFMKSGLSLGILHRYYSPSYYAAIGNAFKENSKVNNEKGFYLAAELRAGKANWFFYADLFSFPWLRYGVDAPSQGAEAGFRHDRKVGPVQLFLSWRWKSKATTGNCSEPVCQLKNEIRQTATLRSSWTLNEQLSFQWRLALTGFTSQSAPSSTGLFLSQDFRYQSSNEVFRIRFRLARFLTEQYDTRIYAYESDLLYAGGVQLHYGRGWRFSMVGDIHLAKGVKIGVKVAQSFYPGEEEIGSGLDVISGSHKTEVKGQIICRF